jgi:hypothetical protein
MERPSLTEKCGVWERHTGNYSGATQGGDLGPNGKRHADWRGEGNSGVKVSAVAAIMSEGNSTPVVNAVCWAKAQTIQPPDACAGSWLLSN